MPGKLDPRAIVGRPQRRTWNMGALAYLEVPSRVSFLAPQLEVWPFGSSANGCGERFSDLDLVITHELSKPITRRQSRLGFLALLRARAGVDAPSDKKSLKLGPSGVPNLFLGGGKCKMSRIEQKRGQVGSIHI